MTKVARRGSSVPEGVRQNGDVAPDPLRELVDAAREGDDHALGELVRRTQPAVWQLCTALGSAGEEEDLVQETYLRALRNIGTYRGDAPVLAWLLSIARRTCADHVRKRERGRRLVRRLLVDAEEGVAHVGDPLDDLLRHLDPDRREAFVLTQMIGLPYDEAAAAIGCPIGTVRSRVARARADLASLIRRAEAR
jgi:RNA polymerase sigma-70 factor (ECF subfamily)